MIDPIMLQYLDGEDQDQLEDWSRSHMEWHQVIYTTAINKGFPRYDIYPALRDMGDIEGWAYFHQREHANMAASLRIGNTPDLSGADPSDPESWASWLAVHADVHAFIRTQLGII